MKRRIVISLIVCAVFFVITSAFFAIKWYINSSGYHGIDTPLFVSVNVTKVPAEEDIKVTAYPPTDLRPHGSDINQIKELNLNDIDKGWIINQYNGNCRLLFEVNDAAMENIWDYEIDHANHYYYAEIVPKSRLEVTDPFSILHDDKTDPFAQEEQPHFLSHSVDMEISEHRMIRSCIRPAAIVNGVFIVLVILFNIVLSIVKKPGVKSK